jgi:hypothetical protein
LSAEGGFAPRLTRVEPTQDFAQFLFSDGSVRVGISGRSEVEQIRKCFGEVKREISATGKVACPIKSV